MAESYRVVVSVEEMDEQGKAISTPGQWEVSSIRFGSLGDAITHGQRVRRAAEKLTPKVSAGLRPLPKWAK